MPKAILEFNLPEEQDEFNTVLKATDMSIALFDIRQEVFRPARKHLYNDSALNEMIEKINNACDIVYKETDELERPSAQDLIWMLERKFSEILNERDLKD
jgi:hypothetical protein